MLGETTAEVNNVEVMKNLLMGLLAGDVGLWALLIIVVLVCWVAVDIHLMWHGMPRSVLVEHHRALSEDVRHSDWIGNRWHTD